MPDITPSARPSEDAFAFAEIASAAIRQARTFVGLYDAGLHLCFLNAAGRQMVGLSSEADIAGYQIVDFFIAEQRDFIETVVLPTLLNEGCWEGELFLRHFLGATRQMQVRWSGFTLYDRGGAIIGVATFTSDLAPLKQEERILRDQQALLSIELVAGVSRETTERRLIEAQLRQNEARLRAATDLAGLGIYFWDPATGALEWDERLHAMWGIPADLPVDMNVFERGIHPDDLPLVHRAIAQCVDPNGDGRYNVEYRVIGRDDGITRHIATSGQTTFSEGRAVSFIGAALDVTAQRRNEAAIRASEDQFRSFAEHSSNLIWIGDSEAATIIYCSAAYERIWGVPSRRAPTAITEWMEHVHPEDRQQVEHSLGTVKAGEAVQFEYRIVRPSDGAIRWLRDTSFPIPDDNGVVTRIGGITEDLTLEDTRQVYIVSTKAAEARRLAGLVRALGYRARTFDSASAFLDLAPVLAPGCVFIDIRTMREEALSIPRELKARSVMLPVVALDAPRADVAGAVAAMKAGLTDYVIVKDEPSLRLQLATVMAECHGALRPSNRNEDAGARVARLTSREREVLFGLVEGGTNKTIAQDLGISPRTVELHRAQVMNRLNAGSLVELIQTALAAGITPSSRERSRTQRKNNPSRSGYP